MRINCEVAEISNSGETIKVRLKGKEPRAASWRYDATQEIEIICTEKTKRMFWLGRKVALIIDAH